MWHHLTAPRRDKCTGDLKEETKVMATDSTRLDYSVLGIRPGHTHLHIHTGTHAHTETPSHTQTHPSHTYRDRHTPHTGQSYTHWNTHTHTHTGTQKLCTRSVDHLVSISLILYFNDFEKSPKSGADRVSRAMRPLLFPS